MFDNRARVDDYAFTKNGTSVDDALRQKLRTFSDFGFARTRCTAVHHTSWSQTGRDAQFKELATQAAVANGP
jgi:hypothetical protein